MLRQNLIFAFIAPLVLATFIALSIVGLGSSLLWIAEHGGDTAPGRAFGELLGLHGHDVGKGLAVVVALLYSIVILGGGSIASRLAPPGPRHAEH